MIGAEEAVSLLRFEVYEKGADHVYANPAWESESDPMRSCYNFHGSEPGCIVGHVLHRLGLTAELAEDLRIAGPAGVYDAREAVNTLDAEKFGFEINQDAANILFSAQAAQDNHFTWGEALAAAEQELVEILDTRTSD